MIFRQPQGGRAQRCRTQAPVSIPSSWSCAGYFCLQPVACARRDLESKGVVEGGALREATTALAGRVVAEELTRFEDYLALASFMGAIRWPMCANTSPPTSGRSIASGQELRVLLRPLPAIPFDTDEVESPRPSSIRMPASSSTAIAISAPPQFRCADRSRLRRQLRRACACCTKAAWWPNTSAVMERGQLLVPPEHRLTALTLSPAARSSKPFERELDSSGTGGKHVPSPSGIVQPSGQDRRACPSFTSAWLGAPSTGGPKCSPPWPGP